MNKIIAAYGDSTQEGTVFIGKKPWANPMTAPIMLQQKLQKRYGTGVTVINKGMGGITTPDRLNGATLSDGRKVTSWEYEMRTSTAHIVINNTGINDTFLVGYTVAQHTSNYKRLWEIARANNKTFIIETPNPINDLTNRNEALRSYTLALIQLSKTYQIPIIDQWSIITNWWPTGAMNVPPTIPNWKDYMAWCDSLVGQHPDGQLYDYKATNSFTEIVKLV